MTVGRLLIAASVLLGGCSGDEPSPPKTIDAPNEAPGVDILEPLGGALVPAADAITFSIRVSDDAEVSELAVAWASDVDGVLRSEAPERALVTFSEDGLSVGEHLVTVTATDAGGLTATDTVMFRVVAYDGTLVVDSIADTVDARPRDGLCDDGSGACTLRAAIMEANAWGVASTITFASEVIPGTFALALEGRGEDDARTGDLDVRTELSIVGAGAQDTVLDGAGLDRVLHVHPTHELFLSGLTVQNGHAEAERGGGIRNDGRLTIEGSRLVDNRADGAPSEEGGGGGLFNTGRSVHVVDSTVQGNVSTEAGAGLCNMGGGQMTLLRSTVRDNESLDGIGDGGGVANYDGVLTITNSTFSDNLSEGEGGAIFNLATLDLSSSTLVGNINRQLLGTSIRNVGTARIRGSILMSTHPGDECTGDPIESLGHNLDSDGTCGSAASDLSGGNPLLEPLQDNGGPTDTHALQAGSPAIDAIPEADCVDADGAPLMDDQRGVARPQGAACDIGAYEAE